MNPLVMAYDAAALRTQWISPWSVANLARMHSALLENGSFLGRGFRHAHPGWGRRRPVHAWIARNRPDLAGE